MLEEASYGGLTTGLTTGLTVGRVFGLTDWSRNGSLAEYTAVEARNLAPLPADVDHVVAAALPISGLTVAGTDRGARDPARGAESTRAHRASGR